MPDLPRTPLVRGILSPLPSHLPAELVRKQASSSCPGAGAASSSTGGKTTECEAAVEARCEEQRVALDISDSQRWFQDWGQDEAPQTRQSQPASPLAAGRTYVEAARASSVPLLEQGGHPLQVHRPPALGEEVEADVPRHATSSMRGTPKISVACAQPAFSSAALADTDSAVDDRRSRLFSFANNLVQAGAPPPTSLATKQHEAASLETTPSDSAQHAVAIAHEGSSGAPSPTPAPGTGSFSAPLPLDPQPATTASANNELAALASRLEATPSEDAAALVEVLEELGRLHVTTDLLREFRLGLLTRGLVEHPDRTVRSAVRRLRTSWKKLVLELATGASSLGAGGAEGVMATGGA